MCWCTRTQPHRAKRLGEGLGHRGGAKRRAGAHVRRSSDPMRETGRRARGSCDSSRVCPVSGGTHGCTTGTPILLISIRFPLENKEGRDTPKDTPALVVLVAAGLIGTGKERRARAEWEECSDPMIEAGTTSTGKVVVLLECQLCTPHRRYSWSHHRSLHAFDVRWNPIRKYKEARAPRVRDVGALTL
jgi:hypothetical protein